MVHQREQTQMGENVGVQSVHVQKTDVQKTDVQEGPEQMS